jgi:hypothetical protein
VRREGIEARDGKVSGLHGTVESVILLSLSNSMTGKVKEIALHSAIQYRVMIQKYIKA